MFKIYISLFLVQIVNCFAQPGDTLILKEYTVESYFISRPVLRLPAAVSVIDSARLKESDELVDAFNAAAGVRMEERSPGSYRLSVRGSLLRSPFGIRNLKIYIDDYPLTDAGGNTYLNLLDMHAIKRMEILKGPDGSLFGANSGGVVRIHMMNELKTGIRVNAQLKAGSFDKLNGHADVAIAEDDFRHNVFASFIRSDGYRQHSSLKRKYVHLNESWGYSPKGNLSLFTFYSDINYLTPGGLTAEQYSINRKAARPSNAAFPGAVEQKAAVTNKTFFTGIKHDFSFNHYLRHVVTLSGSVTAFDNPFITNYEEREEKNQSLRTWFQVGNNKMGNIGINLFAGVEGQVGHYEVFNYGNSGGEKDSLQSGESIDIRQGFGFIQLACDIYNKVQVEGSVSLNRHAFDLQSSGMRTLKMENMPRLAASWLMSDHIALRISASKGYSPPTFAEIRASDQRINTDLNAESGWNYESGVRLRTHGGFHWMDVSVYSYNLKDAIVRRLNDNGEEFFVNAGSTIQKGGEISMTADVVLHKGIFDSFRFTSSYSYSHYRFGNYSAVSSDYSGLKITGVPSHDANADLMIVFKHNIYCITGFHYTSSIPLNDANTVFSDESHVFNFKAGWSIQWRRSVIAVNSGVNNILNELYSAGYDLNAAGGRYYNAAPERNYYLQVSFTL